MKILISMLCLLSSTVAFAQRSYSSYSSKVANVSLGMTSSALNIGARMETDSNQAAFGGYFFLQTEKSDAGIPQVMSFGGHTLLKLVDASNSTAYLAPGVGVAIVKGIAGASDTTVVGPSFRYGAQFKTNNGGAIGIERLEMWNWFDSKAGSSSAFTSAVYSFSF